MITEGFDPSVCAPTLGGFTVRFKAGTESKLLGPHEAGDAFNLPGRTNNWKHDTICFTPTRLANPSAASVLASSLFSGRSDRFAFGAEGEPWALSGPSILAWLGTADNPGIGPFASVTRYTTASPFTGTLADFLLAAVTGNRNNGLTLDATSLTATALNCAINNRDILRHAINQLVIVADAEYTCHPSGTVEFQDGDDTGATVFTWTPTVIFGEGIQSGREAGLAGYQARVGATFDYTNEGETAVVASSDGNSVGGSSLTRIDQSFGGDVDVAANKFYGADDDLLDQGPTPFLAATDLCRSDTISCEVDAHLIRRDCKPGDWVYLISERLGIINTANSVNYGGRTLPPQKRKLTGLSYPITEGMGVYVIHDSTQYQSGAVQDVTEDVIWETGTTTVSLDTTAPKSLRRAVLGTQHRPTWRKA